MATTKKKRHTIEFILRASHGGGTGRPRRLRRELPEGTRVEIVESRHPWLEPGMVGTIHWNHRRSVLPSFHTKHGNGHLSVQLVAPRDKVKILEEKGQS